MSHVYAKITGTDQKDFKGACTRKGREGWIEVDMQMESNFSVDPNSGKPKGALNPGSFVFTCEEATHSPNVIQAHMRKESLSKVVIEKCMRAEDGKGEEVVSSWTLEDAYINNYRAYPSGQDTDRREDPRHMESFSISFRKITFEHKKAKNQTSYDWNTPNG